MGGGAHSTFPILALDFVFSLKIINVWIHFDFYLPLPHQKTSCVIPRKHLSLLKQGVGYGPGTDARAEQKMALEQALKGGMCEVDLIRQSVTCLEQEVHRRDLWRKRSAKCTETIWRTWNLKRQYLGAY